MATIVNRVIALDEPRAHKGAPKVGNVYVLANGRKGLYAGAKLGFVRPKTAAHDEDLVGQAPKALFGKCVPVKAEGITAQAQARKNGTTVTPEKVAVTRTEITRMKKADLVDLLVAALNA